MIKKIFSLTLAIVIIVLMLTSCGITSVKTTTISNIISCINNIPIDSHIIDGESYVSVDDLSHFGFDVSLEGTVFSISVAEEGKIDEEYRRDETYNVARLGKKGMTVEKCDYKVTFGDDLIETVKIENKVYFPFMSLKAISDGYADKFDVQKIYINEIEGYVGENEYRYLKMKSKDYNIEDFSAFTLRDVTNVFGNDYTRTFEDEYAVIEYDKKVCPVKLYFSFSEDTPAETMLNSRVLKLSTSSPSVKFDNDIKVGMKVSQVESLTEKRVHIYEEETRIYGRYRHNGNYTLCFELEKTKDDYKITGITVE